MKIEKLLDILVNEKIGTVYLRVTVAEGMTELHKIDPSDAHSIMYGCRAWGKDGKETEIYAKVEIWDRLPPDYRPRPVLIIGEDKK